MQYIIKKGDTLSQIALDHGVSVNAILQVNQWIVNKNKIYAGTTIEIPTSPATTVKSWWDWFNGLMKKITG